jgi:excisionase family DNA binding protein
VTYLTPPAVARRLAVRPGKVLAWISAGELPAANLAESASGRPRWRIAETDLADFLAARAARPQPSTPRRRVRRPTDVLEFF